MVLIDIMPIIRNKVTLFIERAENAQCALNLTSIFIIRKDYNGGKQRTIFFGNTNILLAFHCCLLHYRKSVKKLLNYFLHHNMSYPTGLLSTFINCHMYLSGHWAGQRSRKKYKHLLWWIGGLLENQKLKGTWIY